MTGFRILVNKYEWNNWNYWNYIEEGLMKSDGRLMLICGLEMNHAATQILDVAQIDELIKQLQVAKDELIKHLQASKDKRKQLPMIKSKEDDLCNGSDYSSSCEDSEVGDTDGDKTSDDEEKDSSITMTPAGTNKQTTISFKGFGI
jgi:hypothetical protein